MAILEVHNLAKSFGTAEVLREISFSIEEGESLAVIGSSGSGKTTLLRCLNFLEQPDSGQIIVRGKVLFDGEDPNTFKEKEIRKKRLHFGLVFQTFHLFPQYTALQNVTMAKEFLVRTVVKRRISKAAVAEQNPDSTRKEIKKEYKRLKKECREESKQAKRQYKRNKTQIHENIRADGMALLEQVGLSPKKDLYPHQLSGGQQQRVAIARALALEPDILCFDEPTSALDPELTGEVLRVIRGLAANNTTMVIVTHEMQFAREVADKILFMDEGLVVEYGTPEQVFDHPKSQRTRQFLERYIAG